MRLARHSEQREESRVLTLQYYPNLSTQDASAAPLHNVLCPPITPSPHQTIMETTYRDAIAELETILRALETDTVDVDDLTARVQRSAELIRLCKQKLRNAESAIEKVFENLEEEDEHEPTEEPDSFSPPEKSPARHSQKTNGLPGQLPF